MHLRSPEGKTMKTHGPKLIAALKAQGWTEIPDPPKEPRPTKRKGYYVNHNNFSGW